MLSFTRRFTLTKIHRQRAAIHVVSSPIKMPEIDSHLTEMPFPRFLLNSFDKYSNDVALVDGSTNQEITFNNLRKRTFQTASALKSKFNIGQGDCVAIMSPNHIDYFPAFHGTSLTGAFSTTANPLYTVEELTHQIETTRAKVIISHPMCLPQATEVAKKRGLKVITFDKTSSDPEIVTFESFVGDQEFEKIDLENFVGGKKAGKFDPESLVTVPFSSGTTGRPKGVMLTHRNLCANVLQALPYEGNYLSPEANGGNRGVLLVPLPFFHIYGMIAGMCLPLYVGGKVVFLPAFNLQSFLEIIQQHKVTRAHIVPPIALALAKHPMVDKYDLSSIKCLMSGAAPLGADVQEACANRLKCLVKQAWGMTETSPCGAITPDHMVTDVKDIKGFAGILVPNTEAKIVCPINGHDLPYHMEGELLVRGPQIMKGYLNNEEATKNTIRPDGWLHTGDIGHFTAEGWLKITDRSKELIKYKGFQVPPAELEALILTMPQVKDAIVIPVPDDEAGEIPRAYVVKQDNVSEEFSEQNVIDFVASKVAPHKKLRGGVKFVHAVPKSASGKLLRRVQIQIDRGQIPPL